MQSLSHGLLRDKKYLTNGDGPDTTPLLHNIRTRLEGYPPPVHNRGELLSLDEER
jgi:hypothetical protein